LDIPFVTDPYFYVLAVALIVALAAILQPTSNVVSIDWGRRGARIACFVLAFFLAAVGALGEEGWLRPKPAKDQPAEAMAQNEGPCTAEQLDPQGYYDVGLAWNNHRKFDRAIAFFSCGEAAIAKMTSDEQKVWQETHGFIVLDWGNALRAKAVASHTRDEWCAAKGKFQKARELFVPIGNKPEVNAALKDIQTYLAEAGRECK